MTLSQMNTYKFRAECLCDALKFKSKISCVNFEIQEQTLLGYYIPDVEVSFESEMSLEELKDVLRTIQDGHVMLETIQSTELYTGQRIL